MLGDFHIAVAGINLIVRSPLPVSLRPLEAAYRSFVRQGMPSRGLDVRIRLASRAVPRLPAASRMCDARPGWELYQIRGRRCLVRSAPNFPRPFWMARIRRDGRQVHVSCDPSTLIREGRRAMIPNPVCYPLDQIVLMYALAASGGILVHAAGSVAHGRGLLYPGRSGAGKSTISRCLLSHAAHAVLSDDRIVVREGGGGVFRMFGTPWPGDAGVARNAGAPLSAVIFLNKARRNAVRPVPPAQALARLLPAVSIPWYDRDVTPPILALCDRLLARVPAYELDFAPGRAVGDLLQRLACGL